MRVGLLLLGIGFVCCSLWRTLDSWSTIIDPSARQLAYDRVAKGMTYQEVASILGEDGEFRNFAAGSVKPGSTTGAPFMQTFRWEDYENTFDVRFEGYGENLRATEITRRTKAPADHVELQQSRLGLLLLGGIGLLFAIAGLHGRPKRAAAPPNA